MYQSISQRFRRKNSNDLIVTFLPVVVVLTLHSYLRSADLNPTLFRVLQITANPARAKRCASRTTH